MPHLVSLVLGGVALLTLFVVKKAVDLVLTNEYVGWARILARLLVRLAGIICPSRAREWRAGLRYFQEQDKADPGLRMAASHLAWSPLHSLLRVWNRFSEALRPVRLLTLLTPGEQLIYRSRRHKVVLTNSLGVLAITLVLGVVVGSQRYRWPAGHLTEIGLGISLLGVAFFSWRAGNWALTTYVITNERILLIEDLIGRRITALPLRLVIDMTYRRTIWGRLLGYCNLELNLSGHQGLRSMTRVPNADRVYALILRLLSEPGRSQLLNRG
jgi:hypothetical protein